MNLRIILTRLFTAIGLALTINATLLLGSVTAKEPTGILSGAVCRDGWISQSSGSGTCSHHGGVLYWTGGNTLPSTPIPLPLFPLPLPIASRIPTATPPAFAPIPARTPTVTIIDTPVYIPATAGSDLLAGLIGIVIFLGIPIALYKLSRR